MKEKMEIHDKLKQTSTDGPFKPGKVVYDVSLFTDYDIHLFREGKHFNLYEKMGSHVITDKGTTGTFFAVWAPNAASVSVICESDSWKAGDLPLQARSDGSGIWTGFIPGLAPGELYKYRIVSAIDNYTADKADPFANYCETPPGTSSVIYMSDFTWNDSEWMSSRKEKNSLSGPFSIYEIHAGSWKRMPGEGRRPLTYRELAEQLPEYLNYMGYTHVEFMPVAEHPFTGSWGYQVTGYFAPTSRYGLPDDFMFLVDTLHRHNIGVIVDWVPSHFPGDLHGLHFFDGTYLYEHEDPRQGFHPDWKSYIFNYSRNEVRDFLISSAHFWLDKYHVDALRVDGVASMLYLDYSRKQGEWVPNQYGGRENINAISFLRDMNESVYTRFPDIQTIAEESTAWPMVTRPVYTGGLGFGMKWNMGWMHDTIEYFSKDPLYRSYHHNMITFSIMYAFSENYILALSHDEVVHGKRSLIGRMPGDLWQKFANMRLLFGYMYAHPGKKTLFMGMDIGQWSEWDHDSSVEWHLLDVEINKGLQTWVRDLNSVYLKYPAFHETDFAEEGFRWIDADDSANSIISFMRISGNKKNIVIAICNMTSVPRYNYRMGVPFEMEWKEVLNSDGTIYGGSGQGNMGSASPVPVPYHSEDYSISVTLPPLAIVIFSNY